VFLADVHFASLVVMDSTYRSHATRLRALASELGLEIVPGAFQVGRSNLMLASDPNLAEGVPVRGARFVVHGGEARLAPDPPVALGRSPDWADLNVRLMNGVASTTNVVKRARIRFTVKVAPFRCYHVSVRIRSRDFSGEALITAVGGRRSLDFVRPFEIAPTQDWTRYDVVFNSLDHDRAAVWMGLWRGSRGTLEWKDWSIEEVGLLNVLRRPGAPVVVEGRIEGRDYEPIADPELEAVAGSGHYSPWHEPPPIRTSLPEGTELRVSWYQPAFFYGAKTTCCPSDSGAYALLAAEAQRLRTVWEPTGWLMMQNEIRCLGWDPPCRAAGATAGEILAAHMRRCRSLLAGARVYAWGDMFNPGQNAREGYYLVNGDLAGAWEGLDTSVVILNWAADQRERSVRWFSGRGHRQILAGYYDGNVEDIRDWLRAARGVPGVIGVMYTTWENRYDDLEAFARIVRGRS
jgi:hypothetical protein